MARPGPVFEAIRDIETLWFVQDRHDRRVGVFDRFRRRRQSIDSVQARGSAVERMVRHATRYLWNSDIDTTTGKVYVSIR